MTRRLLFTLLGIGLLCAVPAASTLAQTGSGFDLTWNVMGGGGPGDPLISSGFSVRSTLGQTVVGAASGSCFNLRHGYWMLDALVYLPIVLRDY